MANSQDASLVDISCELLHETDRAWLITDDGEREVWIPKTLAEWDGDAKELTMPEWLAKREGLI